MSNSLWPHELQHARLLCPSPSPGVNPSSRPLNQQCHPTISSSVTPFSFCPQSFPASGSFQMSQLFTSWGQSIGASASASVLPVNLQCGFPLGLTGLISLLSQELSRVSLVGSFMIWWLQVLITGNSGRPSIALLVNSTQVIAIMSAHFFLCHFPKKLRCVLIYMQTKRWPDGCWSGWLKFQCWWWYIVGTDFVPKYRALSSHFYPRPYNFLLKSDLSLMEWSLGSFPVMFSIYFI